MPDTRNPYEGDGRERWGSQDPYSTSNQPASQDPYARETQGRDPYAPDGGEAYASRYERDPYAAGTAAADPYAYDPFAGQGSQGAHAQRSAYEKNAYEEAVPTGSTGDAVSAEAVPVSDAAVAQAPSAGPSSGRVFLVAFLGALVACILAFGVTFGFGLFDDEPSSGTILGAQNGGSVEASDVEATLAEAVADKCLPSVVSIDVFGSASSASSGMGSLYDYLYGGTQQDDTLTEVSLGSGVILSEDGYIITNYHVVESGSKYQVTIQGDVYEADLVGSESSSDVAVLKVKNGSGFTPIAVADSDDIRIGEWVMAIGSPFGLEQSVSTGIVSATSRSQVVDSSESSGGSGETTIYPNMIQTDAAINPGNSGGALVNANGELIGINTLITSYSGNYSGVGFAIPSNYAISLADSIIGGEEPTHAQLGITMSTVNASIAQRYGFSATSGAYVSSVADGSAAATAGIEVGDIITAFDGEAVTSASDLMLDVRTKSPGDEVTLTIDRDGQTTEVTVTLGSSTSR